MNGTNGAGGTFSTPLTRLSSTTRLVDQYGRAVTDADASAFGAPADPIGSSATAGVIKRDIPIVLTTTWDLEGIRRALAEHMFGNFRMSAFLCDATTGDDRVAATLGQRMGALFSRPMHTTPADDSSAAADCAAAWDKAWDRFAPHEVLEELHAWGKLCGAVPIELQWDRSVLPWQPILKPWHPTHLSYRWDLRRYQIATLDGIEIIEPGDGRWILYTPHGPYRGWRRGAVRPIATPWFFRQLIWRDWGRYNERHGLAIIKAMAPARSDPALRDRWVAGLAGLGQESVVLCPQQIDGTGFDVGLLEAKAQTYDSFDRGMGRADMSIVLALLWQNLTTEVSGGSYAAAVVHEGVQQTGVRFDAKTLADCLYRQAARPFAEWNFGNADLAPKREWQIARPADHLTSAQTFQAFGNAISTMRSAGLQLTASSIARLAFAFNLPISAEDIVTAAAKVEAGGDPPTGKEPPK